MRLLFLALSFCLHSVALAEYCIQGMDLNRVLAPYNSYFQYIQNFSVSLVQTNHNGTKVAAKLYLMPHRLRLIYKDYELRAAKNKLVYFDLKNKTSEELNMDQTPLFFLFSKKRLEDVTYVDHIVHFPEHTELTLRNKTDPKGPILILIFKRKPLSLVGWRLKDPENKTTSVVIVKSEYNKKNFNTGIFIDP